MNKDMDKRTLAFDSAYQIGVSRLSMDDVIADEGVYR